VATANVTPAAQVPPANLVPLVQGEKLLFRAEFTPHPILRHLKTKLVITDRRVVTRQPMTWFVFFRKGFHQSACPLEHISQFSYGDRNHGRRLVTGILLCLTLFGLPMGVYYLLTLRSITLSIRATGAGLVMTEADRKELPMVEAAARVIDAILYAAGPPTSVMAVAPPPMAAAPVAAPGVEPSLRTGPAYPAAIAGQTSAPGYGRPWPQHSGGHQR